MADETENNGQLTDEFYFGDEADADPDKLMAECEKNPGHNQFIHCKEFGRENLSEKYQNDRMVKTVGVIADLTVKIKSIGKSDGKMKVGRGSGWVLKVEKHDTPGKECTCEKCEKSPSKVWWEVFILTANHVFAENQTTYVSFNYEKDGTERRIKGRSLSVKTSDGDRVMVFCATCDEDFCTRLSGLCEKRKVLVDKCNKKYRHDSLGLTILVSHPHGSEKRISIGSGVSREDQELCSIYSYEAPSCSGSSGGFVWAVGWGSDDGSTAPHREGGILEYGQKNRSSWSWPL